MLGEIIGDGLWDELRIKSVDNRVRNNITEDNLIRQKGQFNGMFEKKEQNIYKNK